MSPRESFSVYLCGVGEKRVAITQNQVLDYTLPHWLWMPSFQTAEHLPRQLEYPEFRMGSISSEVVRLRYPGCVERPLITL